MNLEANVSDDLWRAVRTTYENRNYRGAILEAVHLLSDRLREKADIDGDGQALVGEALGGEHPRLKVTRLESETDKSIQKGIEFLLRGVYAAIRNPRSHERHTDTEQDAQAIILFIDYLLRVIGASKPPFTVSDFVDRIVDPDFVEQSKYAELLVEEVPRQKRLEVAFRAFHEKEKVKGRQLELFLEALFEKLSEEAKSEFFSVVTDELKTTSDASTIRSTIRALPPEEWSMVGDIARIRIENKLLDEVEEGKYDENRGRCTSGSLGTWMNSVIGEIDCKNKLKWILVRKLESDDYQSQGYVLKYFFNRFPSLLSEPTQRLEKAVISGLKDGDKRFYDAVTSPFLWPSDIEWSDEVQEAIDDFEEAEPEFTDDPIMGGEDDLPF